MLAVAAIGDAHAVGLEIGVPFFELAGYSIGLVHLLWLVIVAGISTALVVARRTGGESAQALAEAEEQATALERALSLINSDGQLIILWERPEASPEVIGKLDVSTGVPLKSEEILLIGDWIASTSVKPLSEAVQRLRRQGQPFSMTVTTKTNAFVEARGRAVGGRVVVRLRDLTGERRDFAKVKAQANLLLEELSALRALTEALPYPLWRRHADGALAWVNKAYIDAVEGGDHDQVVERGVELLNTSTRASIRAAHHAGETYRDSVPVVVAGDRRTLDLVDLPLKEDSGSIGIGIDATELGGARVELKRALEAQAMTLNQVNAAVAIFGSDQRLQFCNAAYHALWELDAAFLADEPQDGEILDRLRLENKLPEQASYRDWRAEQLSAYGADEPRNEIWHLPSGRTVSALAVPNLQGGVTHVYEDVSERIDLESRFNALARVQGETLDHLQEGVAVFGQDGRLRLHNPVFADLWRLSASMLAEGPHIGEVVEWCSAIHDDSKAWTEIRESVTDSSDREPLSGRMERPDGSVVDYSLTALPEGLTMLTIVDVTDAARVERALIDRNEALEAADRLKSAFVQHVSYELRSPLTSIIGFAEMLSGEAVGALNERQREYMDHIATSSGALLAIINDILDLATVDAGIVSLEVEEVGVRAIIDEAAQGVADRLRDESISLAVDVPEGIGSFHADPKRVRQILYNLLSNAARFSHEGGHIELTCRREAGWMEFIVRDNGMGIPQDHLPQVFNRFESRASRAGRRGAGLGLTIVKSFVELHGGTVDVDSVEGEGTEVTARFPEEPEAELEAAE